MKLINGADPRSEYPIFQIEYRRIVRRDDEKIIRCTDDTARQAGTRTHARAAVNPTLDAAGKTSCFTPRGHEFGFPLAQMRSRRAMAPSHAHRPTPNLWQPRKGAAALSYYLIISPVRRDDRRVPRPSMRRSTTGRFRRAALRRYGVVRCFPLLYRGSVMPNNAAHGRTGHRMMARHVADNPAYCGALYTTVGIGDDGKSRDCNRQQQLSHV